MLRPPPERPEWTANYASAGSSAFRGRPARFGFSATGSGCDGAPAERFRPKPRPSVESFKAKVERGIYSQPVRQMGCLPKWHRERLTHDIAERHGLRHELLPLAENIEHLI